MLEFPVQHQKSNVEKKEVCLHIQSKKSRCWVHSEQNMKHEHKKRTACTLQGCNIYLCNASGDVSSNIARHLYRQFHQTIKPYKK